MFIFPSGSSRRRNDTNEYIFQVLFVVFLIVWKSVGVPTSLHLCLNTFRLTASSNSVLLWSGHKDGLEQVHTVLRMILSKESSFEFFTQWEVNLIVSHINSSSESVWGKDIVQYGIGITWKRGLNCISA